MKTSETLIEEPSATAAKEKELKNRLSSQISVLQGNFRSLFNKQDLSCSFTDSCSADTELGTETWLSSDVSDCQL